MSPTIRLATPADAPAIRDIYAPFVTETAVSFEEDPPGVAAMRERIADTTERFPWLVCERDGDVVGYAYAGAHRTRAAYRWSVDSSVYVRGDARRAGVARGLYESLFAILRLQGFYNVFAGTTIPNPASTGFHAAMGFDPVGTYEGVGYKRGAWHDVTWWHLSLGERPDDPDDPLPLPEAREEPEWEDAVRTGERSVDR